MEMGRTSKRLCSRDDDGEGGDRGENDVVVGRWEGLNPEILALIFVKIPAHELIRDVSLVCKSWLAVLAGPYCWTDIDVEQWCRWSRRPEIIDSAVRKLVRRSRGTFRRLSAYKLGNSGFSFAANFGRCLKILQMPMSDVTDIMVEKHVESLVNVTVLDISCCLKITCKGLEALGKNCRSLIHLKRNMPPLDFQWPAVAMALKIDDSEAMIIANTMPSLHHLELSFGRFGNLGLNAILSKCKALTHLDIQGCWNVELQGDIEDKCVRLLVFKDPWFEDCENGVSSDNADDDDNDESSSSESD